MLITVSVSLGWLSRLLLFVRGTQWNENSSRRVSSFDWEAANNILSLSSHGDKDSHGDNESILHQISGLPSTKDASSFKKEYSKRFVLLWVNFEPFEFNLVALFPIILVALITNEKKLTVACLLDEFKVITRDEKCTCLDMLDIVGVRE